MKNKVCSVIGKVYTLTLQSSHVILAIFTCSLFLGCQQGESEYDNTPQHNLDCLWQTIEQHYCFLDYKEQQLGFHWADIHAKYSAMLNPNMSRTQLFEVLSQMLSELKDGHVNLVSSRDVARNWSWREDYPLNLDTELRDEYLGHDYQIAAGLKYRILPDNIGYVVYESFSNGVGEGNLDEVMYALRLCNGLILDVRGNTGGELTNAERISRRFTNKKLLVGYTSHKTGPGRKDFSSPEPEYIEPSKGVRWQKKAIVLTNRSCYSATNTFVRNMKEMPLVTILGDQTGGGAGLPFTSELPNGWSVRFSACPSFDAHMEQIEFGIQPDVPCQLDTEQAKQGVDTMIEAARQLLQ